MNYLIKNVHLVDAELNTFGDVLISDGLIKEIALNESIEGDKNIITIDGHGLTLMPAFIDMHCHLREPGFEYKETLKTGMLAALKGGFTTLCAMANTNPVVDKEDVVKKILNKAKALELCDLVQVCAVTEGFNYEKLVEFENLMQYTPIFSNDGKSIENKEIMIEALKASENNNFKICTHCQPEVELVKRDIELLEKYGGHLHVCHISKAETVLLIKGAKERGLDITCEVTPHHIYRYGLNYKVNPPFRAKEDQLSLVKAIQEGVVDVCGTDHAPHTAQDKIEGSPGISNFDIAFSLYWKALDENEISINILSKMLSKTPSKLLGLKNRGLIKKDYKADLVLVDLNEEYEVRTEDFISKSNNNPFEGQIIKGRIHKTFKEGEIKYDYGQTL